MGWMVLKVFLGLLALSALVAVTAGKAMKAHLAPPVHLVRPGSAAQQERRERLARSEQQVIQVQPDRWGHPVSRENPVHPVRPVRKGQ